MKRFWKVNLSPVRIGVGVRNGRVVTPGLGTAAVAELVLGMSVCAKTLCRPELAVRGL